MQKLCLLMLVWGGAMPALAFALCDIPGDEVLDAIVRVSGDAAEGSGVIVARNRVVTAAHVIEDMENPWIGFNGIYRRASVVSVYPQRDIAVMAVNTGNYSPIPFSLRSLRADDPVWAVGYPLGGNEIVASGQFEGLLGDDLHTTASVNHGQSGGGLMACEEGRYVLAGMVTAFGAIDYGDHYVRLDDFSLSVPSGEIAWLVQAAGEQLWLAEVSLND